MVSTSPDCDTIVSPSELVVVSTGALLVEDEKLGVNVITAPFPFVIVTGVERAEEIVKP